MKDEHLLWDLIDKGRAIAQGNLSKQISFIKDELLKVESEQLFELCIGSEKIFQRGYTHQMIGAGQVINGYCREQELEYFLARLMANGKTSYHHALEMPDEHLSRIINFDAYPLSYKSKEFRDLFWETYYEKLGKAPGEDEDLDTFIYESVEGELDENGESVFERIYPIPKIDPAIEFPRLTYLQQKRKTSKKYLPAFQEILKNWEA